MRSILLVTMQFVLIGGLLWPTEAGHFGPAALLAITAGMLLGAWAIATNRPGNFNIRPDAKADGRLIERGPYRFVRHPMYAALLLAGAGLVLRDPSAWRMLLLAALAVVLHVKTIFEEASLLRRHPGYAEYRARTARWIPHVW